MINNYDELMLVKKELKNRVHQTEQYYVGQYEMISTFVNLSRVHKNKKNEKNRNKIHTLLIQSLSELIYEQKIIKKLNKEYVSFLTPLILTVLSSFIAKKI